MKTLEKKRSRAPLDSGCGDLFEKMPPANVKYITLVETENATIAAVTRTLSLARTALHSIETEQNIAVAISKTRDGAGSIKSIDLALKSCRSGFFIVLSRAALIAAVLSCRILRC